METADKSESEWGQGEKKGDHSENTENNLLICLKASFLDQDGPWKNKYENKSLKIHLSSAEVIANVMRWMHIPV